jgi:hypothetical protein
MSTYRKEKNLIIISLDDCNGDYALDINTGLFYGLKGTPVKTLPRKREIARLFPCWNSNYSNLVHIIGMMLNNTTGTTAFPHWAEALQGADKVDALGFNNLQLCETTYKYIADNIKLFVKWTKNNARFDPYAFKEWCEFEKMRSSLGGVSEDFTPRMLNSLTDCGRHEFSAEEIRVAAYYLTNGKVWEYEGTARKIQKYLNRCRKMGKTPTKTNNFIKEYVETKKDYELYKTQFDKELMRKNYAKHSKAWEFEYGDYVVVIPTEPKDIIDEGVNMHHCVGGYVDRVVEGEDYICFVRHKDTPDKCYITCEVYTDGRIGQYFLAHDRYISTCEDRAFQEAFARHLAKVWGE